MSALGLGRRPTHNTISPTYSLSPRRRKGVVLDVPIARQHMRFARVATRTESGSVLAYIGPTHVFDCRDQYCPLGSSPSAYWPYMVLTASQLRLMWEAAA